ncbi:hypothetical protein E4U59_005660 [Claviceps monticola]|nr:hypothetical protein E4U59_005660 [Claviceps monticola]
MARVTILDEDIFGEEDKLKDPATREVFNAYRGFRPYPQVMIHSDLEFANEKLKRVETEQNGQAQAQDEATGSADGTESAQTSADANANGVPLEKLGTYDKYEITTTTVKMNRATASPTGRSDTLP